MHGRMTALAVAFFAVALPAAASPQSDFSDVYGDWRPDGVITQCHFTQTQLQNAYDMASANPDFQYENAFQPAVQGEINRWKAGGCSGVAPTKVTKASPLTGARITVVKGRGAPAKEVVRVRNGSKKTLSFRKARLRNGKRGKAVFPAKFKLRKGKTAVVHLGCAKGKRKATFKKTTVWLCARKQLFRDKGDLAKLADAQGVVVSQRGFGSQRRRPVF
jgi:hypothetical protein